MTMLFKTPSEARLYTWDFADFPEIVGGQTLASVLSISGVPTGLTIGAGSISGSKVQAMISAGTAGRTYKVSARARTSAATTPNTDLEVCGELKVVACPP